MVPLDWAKFSLVSLLASRGHVHNKTQRTGMTNGMEACPGSFQGYEDKVDIQCGPYGFQRLSILEAQPPPISQEKNYKIL